MTNNTANSSVYDTTIRLLILLLIVGWCLMIMMPFASIILWSLILALAMFPLHRALSEKIGGRPKMASFILIFLMFIIVVVPTGFLISSLAEEVKELKVMHDEGTLTIPPPNERVKEWPIVGDKVYKTWQSASANLGTTVMKYKDQLADIGKTLVKGILGSVSDMIKIIASFIIAGILLVIGGAGEAIRKFFRKLAGSKGDEFADVAKLTVGNVVKGVLGVAMIQALLIGIGFLLAGVPFAGLWTLLVFVFAVLQIPPTLVVLPVAVYLFSELETLPAVLWTIYLMLAGLSDNFLKPILLGKGAPVPMLVIFIGVVGGFIFSGFIGLFTGAIVMSIGYKLFVGWINSPDEENAGSTTA